jgi:hypothetical protein
VIESINKILNQWVEIKSIRGDYDSAFVSPLLTNFLTLKNIRYFFTPQVFTNRNRVVDRPIRTIRDRFYNLGPNASLFDNSLMQKVVHAYNNKAVQQVHAEPGAAQLDDRTHVHNREEPGARQGESLPDGEVALFTRGHIAVPHPCEGNHKSKKEEKLRHARVLYKILARECAYQDMLFEG